MTDSGSDDASVRTVTEKSGSDCGENSPEEEEENPKEEEDDVVEISSGDEHEDKSTEAKKPPPKAKEGNDKAKKETDKTTGDDKKEPAEPEKKKRGRPPKAREGGDKGPSKANDGGGNDKPAEPEKKRRGRPPKKVTSDVAEVGPAPRSSKKRSHSPDASEKPHYYDMDARELPPLPAFTLPFPAEILFPTKRRATTGKYVVEVENGNVQLVQGYMQHHLDIASRIPSFHEMKQFLRNLQIEINTANLNKILAKCSYHNQKLKEEIEAAMELAQDETLCMEAEEIQRST